MKIVKIIGFLAATGLFLTSCEDEKHTARLDFPNDITFDIESKLAIKIPYLGHIVPDVAFKVEAYHKGSVTFNVQKNADGTHTGFALSSRNFCSYPWSNAKSVANLNPNPDVATLKASADTCIFSVYTGSYPNLCGNFTVVRVSGDDAYFTLDKPRVVEHALVANTDFNYQLLSYGSRYSSYFNDVTQVQEEYNPGTGALAVQKNPIIPDQATSKYRVFYMPDVYNFGKGEDYIRIAGQQILAKREAGRQAADAARAQGKTGEQVAADSTAAATATVKGYVKIIAKGYLGSTPTGTSEHYMTLAPGVDPRDPFVNWNVMPTQSSWLWWDLTPLGVVDKVIFYMDSSDKDASGNMRTPPYFCMDGIRLGEE